MRSLKFLLTLIFCGWVKGIMVGKGNYMEVCLRGIGSGLSPRCLGLRKRRNFRGIFY